MKYLDLQMENSKLMLTQFAPNTSDPNVHSHGSDYQISIPLIGTPFVELSGKVGAITEKQRIVTAPNEEHRHFANEEASRLLLINLSQPFVERVLADELQRPLTSIEFVPWAEGSSDGFRKIADQIIKQTMTSSLERLELAQLEWQLASLLLDLQAGSHREAWRTRRPVFHHPAVQSALDLIHDSFGAELSLDELALASGISKFHLIRLFREKIGSTPSEYVSQVRLFQAERLLKQTDQDVTTIAFEVGFGSLSTFERAFKKKYGVSASQYRKQCR